MNSYTSWFLPLEQLTLLKPYRENIEQYGVHVSLSYNRDRRYICLSFSPADSPNSFIGDGRGLYLLVMRDMTRFSQKLYDQLKDLYEPLLPYLSAVYVLLHGIDNFHFARDEWKSQIEDRRPSLILHSKDERIAHFTELLKSIATKYYHFNINPTEAAAAEVTTPITNMEQTTPTINPGVTICTEEGSAAEQKIVGLMQAALSENRPCIYNICIDGDATLYDVPKVVPLREALGLGADEPFYGWQDYDKITLVEVDKANISAENPVPKMIDLLKPTCKAILDIRDNFVKESDYCMNKGRGTLLISMVTDGGKFHYDYVVMKAA